MEIITKIAAFLSDTITVVLGSFGLWGIFFHREKIAAFARLLAHALVSERIKKIKGALARLDDLNYENKEDKKEVIALLGELAGMIRLLAEKVPSYKVCYDEMIRCSDRTDGLTESKKRRLSEQLHAVLDDQSLAAAVTLITDNNGSTRN